MNAFENRSKPLLWLMVLFITTFLAGRESTAFAAPTPTFSATASGAASSLTLNTSLSIGDADAGRNGNIYLAADTGGGWFIHNGAGWVSWSSGTLPVYSAGTLANRSVEVARNTDLSALGGTNVYVGYGLSESDMLANGKYGLVYTVPSALQTSDINYINAALSGGINAVSADYARQPGSFQGFAAAAPLVITIPLNGQTACPVAGRISYSGNVKVTASETDATIQGLIGFNVSDPTNNLNDCEVGNGIILTGSLVLTIAGSASAGTSAGIGISLTGTINANRRGTAGDWFPPVAEESSSPCREVERGSPARYSALPSNEAYSETGRLET